MENPNTGWKNTYTDVAYVCKYQLGYKIDQIDDKSDSVYLLFYRCDDSN